MNSKTLSLFPIKTLPCKTVLALSISLALGAGVIPSALSAEISQKVTLASSGQSMWGTGSSVAFSNLDNPLFLGAEWDKSGNIFSVGNATYGSNGLKVDAATSGRIGLETGWEIDSGTVNTSLPFEFTFDLPDFNELQDNQTFSMGVTNSTLLSNAFLQTISPTIQTYVDFIVEANASVTATGCYDVWVSTDCGSKKKTLFNIDESFELLSLNRDKDGEVRVLDGFSTLFAVGDSVASVVEVTEETDPDDPEGKKKKKVSIDLKPKVSIGGSPLVEVDVRLPDIIEKEYLGGAGLNVGASGALNVLSTSGSDNFLDISLDVDQLGTSLGILPPLGVTADVDFGIGSVSAAVDLIDLTLTPSLALTQDFSLSIGKIGISYAFDEAVFAGVSGGPLSSVTRLDNLNLNQQIDVTWTDGKNLGVTPIYSIDVSLTNKTGLRIDTTFDIDLIKGSISGEVFGIDMGSKNFGPLASIPFDLGSIELPPLFNNTFALGGFDPTKGNKFLFSTDNIELKAGWNNWNNAGSWESGSVPLINDVTIRNHNNNASWDTVALVTNNAQSGALSILGASAVSIENGGVLSVGGDFIQLESVKSTLNLMGNGQLKLSSMDIIGDGVIQLTDTANLTSLGSLPANVKLQGAKINSLSGNTTISNIALELSNDSTITANNSRLNINDSSIKGDGYTTLSTTNYGSMAFNSAILDSVNLNGEFYVGDKNNTQCVYYDPEAGCYLVQNINNVTWKAGSSGVLALEGSMEVFSFGGSGVPANVKALILDGSEQTNVLVNNGDIIISSDNEGKVINSFGIANQSSLTVKKDFTLVGDGTVTLWGAQDSVNRMGEGAAIRAAGAGIDLVNGAEHTIRGNGAIVGFASIDNQGTIVAQGDELYLANTSLTNNGNLGAEAGGTLYTTSAWSNNGRVFAEGTGLVKNDILLAEGDTNISNLTVSGISVSLSGGQWEASNGGQIDLGRASAASNYTTFNNSADLRLDGATAEIKVGKSIENYVLFNNQQDGSLSLSNGASFDSTKLQNSGTINLANATVKGLENQTGGLVQGHGQVYINHTTDASTGVRQLINEGTIRSDGGYLAISNLDNSVPSTFINRGTVEVMGGSNLYFGGYTYNVFNGTGGTWAAYGETAEATIALNNFSTTDLGEDGMTKLDNVTVKLSGAYAKLEAQYPTDGPTKIINLQESLQDINATAALELANGQHFVASNDLNNQGQIKLQAADLTVINLDNSGTISGHGNLATTSIQNSGVISASGGQLNLSNTITNSGSIQTGEQYGDVLHLNSATINGGNVTVGQNTLLNGDGALQNVLLDNEGTISADATGLSMNLASGSSNSGLIEVTSGVLALQGDSLQNTGGLLTARANSELKLQGITVLGGAIDVVGNGSVLSGYGTLDNIALQIFDGTVTANVNGQRLTLDPGDAAQLMRATLRAENGGILLLTSGDFDNGGGTLIQAREGSVVEIKNISMNGGRLETIGDGKIIDLGSSDFTDMSINANTEVANGGEFNLFGTIINTSSLTALNGGEIVLHNALLTANTLKTITHPDGSVTFESVVTDGQLNIAAGGTFKGEGRVDELAMLNQGKIHADGSKALIFDLKGDLFTNNGEVDITGAGGMQILDNEVVNNGIVNVQSSLTVQSELTQKAGQLQVDGTLVANNVTIDKGSLSGSGMVDADVTVNAEGKIGRGSLILMQDLDLYGTLEIDVSQSGLFSMLDVRGDVTVDSSTKFELMFASDYNPLNGLDFDFSFVNDFINFDLLSITSFLVTGLSEQFDWAVVWDDVNGGFAVDIFEDDSWSPNTNVPEPHTIMLILFGIAFLVLRRKELLPKRKNTP
ncbi:PEP-CTERM sorting domain-containing protein [Paraglaciecola sp. 25GB23A]|uniref:PEP-CTERM sorting domain-containing protein n=1 Tax=Paraglaciecola sp. 25GB23A TaxID=3156068 RepID=UPI0032AF46C2